MSRLSPTCVIYNPAAGRGKTLRELHKVRRQFPGFDFRPSRAPGHAEELALAASAEGFAVVAAAGGDGTVHEVANGLLRSERDDVVFSVWPIGSSNDYAFTLGLTEWWRPPNRGRPRTVRSVDVGRVRSPGGKERFFVNGFGVGFNGSITLESRRIPLLRGLPLYGLALLKSMLWRYQHVPMCVTFDGEPRTAPTLSMSVNLAQREGGFPLMPNASLDDGLFDCLHVGPLSRREVVGFLPAMATGSLPSDYPNLWMQRAARIRIESAEPCRVHLDGEFFCHPEDGVTEFDIELLPRQLRVESFTSPPGRA